jgi:hypothetical protein
MKFHKFVEELCDEAHKRGISWARSCAATSMSESDRAFLKDDARALTLRLHSTPFDPRVNPEDRLLSESYERNLADYDNAEMSLAIANAAIREREREVADYALGAEPRTSGVVTVAGAGLLASGLAISLYDAVHDRIPDPYLACLGALAPSIALGLLITLSLYSTNAPRNRRWALAAGFALSVSAGLLRLAFSGGGVLMTLSLTAFELSVVAFLDWLGRGLSEKYDRWAVERDAHDKLVQRQETVRETGRRAADELERLRDAITTHREMVEFRSLCFQKFEVIEEALKRAELNGAWRAIAEHQGLRRGVAPEYVSMNGRGSV